MVMLETINTGLAKVNKTLVVGSTGGTAIAANSTVYVGHCYQANSSYLLPTSYSGTIKNLYVWVPSSPGVGQTYTCTMMKDNIAQSVTATIVEGTNAAHDTSHSFTVSAGQRISLRVVTSASATPMSLEWSVELDATI